MVIGDSIGFLELMAFFQRLGTWRLKKTKLLAVISVGMMTETHAPSLVPLGGSRARADQEISGAVSTDSIQKGTFENVFLAR
ncbi:hypothetical protein ACFOHS_12470 [Jhaorihella thermophila]